LDLTTDADVANSVNVNMRLWTCTVQFITRVCYTRITTFFLLIS